MDAAGWGAPVKVTGTLKDKNGSVVKQVHQCYRKRKELQVILDADGRQAYDSSATGDIANNTEVKAGTNAGIPAYTPDQKDFNKELSLMVTVKH